MMKQVGYSVFVPERDTQNKFRSIFFDNENGALDGINRSETKRFAWFQTTAHLLLSKSSKPNKTQSFINFVNGEIIFSICHSIAQNTARSSGRGHRLNILDVYGTSMLVLLYSLCTLAQTQKVIQTKHNFSTAYLPCQILHMLILPISSVNQPFHLTIRCTT